MAIKKILRNNEAVVLREGIPDGKRIAAPLPAERRTLWLLLGGGFLSLAVFVYWLVTATTPGYLPLYLMLVVTVGFKLLRLLHEWYHYAAIKVIPPPPVTRTWRVDMLTTFYAGEPYDMVISTLEAMQAVTYPHTTYLCDEADDPYLKEVCARLGVIHVYRGPVKTNAKAGNINYALEKVATGEICVILDPDHKPRPDFLDRVLPYFEQEAVGFVQCVQAYGNQADSLIAKGAAEHTYHFYGPMMMSMNTYGTVQAIGANCTFRRAALDSIGGHAPGLSEDMHTAMRLHSYGWKSVYVPENLSRGLVPETLSAFYKQQLKWSRGTFDLLFYQFPRLAKGFTLPQVIHYLTIPLYFLTGLISAIDIFLPMLALVLVRTPVYADLGELVQVLIPVLVFLILNRLYVQKWTLDRTEKGLHFWGGVLLLNTWWIYLTGFIYAIFRIKVPYIPTPKGDSLHNEWRLSIPNLVVMGLGVGSIGYGLAQDWSPYSWFLASLVMVNIFMLGLGTLIAQRQLTHRLYLDLLVGKWSKPRQKWAAFRYDVIYQSLRSKKLATLLAVMILGLYAMVWGDFFQGPSRVQIESRPPLRGYDGLLWGAEAVSAGSATAHLQVIDLDRHPISTLHRAVAAGYQPWVRWTLPVSGPLDSIYAAVQGGAYDAAIRAWAAQLLPVYELARVAPDLPRPAAGQPARDAAYRAAWHHLATVLDAHGEEQLSLAWEGTDSASFARLWPASPHLQQWALATPSPAAARAVLPRLLAQHPPLREQPYFLTRLTADSLDHGDPATWDALLAQQPAPAGLLLAPDGEGAWPHFARRHRLALATQRDLRPPLAWDSATVRRVNDLPGTPARLRQQDGRFTLLVDDAPFYVRGVAYNPGHDWRDGFAPLTVEILHRDFARLREMGANTIRRYSPTVYDRNLLRTAAAHDLKVMYGFWFDPEIDYYTDLDAIEAYKAEVYARVRQYRGYPAVLGWAIGNETWGILKHYNQPAYLPRVRQAYLHMLEEMAQEIHRLDPGRPVFSMLEHSPTLGQGLEGFRAFAPSIDVIGINSYYEARISLLDSLVAVHSPERPYLVSEFGPKGYWDLVFTDRDADTRLVEESGLEKARDYYRQWQRYVVAHQGKNLGGVAFCWRDRIEGSLTWFGLTDFHNRPKLSYYALQQAWTGTAARTDWPDIRLVVRPFTPQRYEARLIIPDSLRDRYRIRWQLVRDEFLYPDGQVKARPSDARVATISTPSLPGVEAGYRVYAYLEDDQQNVLTASAPINLPLFP